MSKIISVLHKVVISEGDLLHLRGQIRLIGQCCGAETLAIASLLSFLSKIVIGLRTAKLLVLTSASVELLPDSAAILMKIEGADSIVAEASLDDERTCISVSFDSQRQPLVVEKFLRLLIESKKSELILRLSLRGDSVAIEENLASMENGTLTETVENISGDYTLSEGVEQIARSEGLEEGARSGALKDSEFVIEAKSAQQEEKTPLKAFEISAALNEVLSQDKAMASIVHELELTRAELKKLDQLRTQFLANVSHEIRTPMNAIIGLTNMMERGSLSSDQKKWLKLIKDSGTSLLTIINDILDLSKIEAGKFELNYRAFELHDLLSNTVQILHHQADLKNLKLSLQYRVPPEYVISDPVRIRQILVNLIGNALKFSDRGEVSIKVESLGRQGKIRKVRIDVIDQGIGIEPEFMKDLFRPFVQVDGANTRRYGGTGLGLSICKKLVEMLNGEIGAESTLGEGSVFWFIIPLELLEEKLEETAPLKAIRMDNLKPFEGRLILLAEDHPINQMVAISELEDFGASVDVSETGDAAVQACKQRKYDLILMDCQMPVMDGYEAAKELRSQGFTIPIIAMTASAMSGDRERCLAAGMSDYISKPFEKNELKEIVSRWISATTAAPESQRAVEGDTEDGVVVDLAAVERRYGKGAHKLLRAYLDDLETRLVKMKNLLEERAVIELARESHSLAGASGLVFAPVFRELFLLLETETRAQRFDSSAELVAKAFNLQKQLARQLSAHSPSDHLPSEQLASDRLRSDDSQP